MRFSIYVVIVAVCGLYPVACRTMAAEPDTPATREAFSPLPDNIAAHNDHYILWMNFVVCPEGVVNHPEIQCGAHYFLQEFDSKNDPVELKWMYRFQALYGCAVVLNNGSVLAQDANTRWLAVAPEDRLASAAMKPVHDEETDGPFILFPEGAIRMRDGIDPIQDHQVSYVTSIWWIPIHDHQLDVSSEILLEKHPTHDVKRFVRHGDEIAWLVGSSNPTAKNGSKPHPATLYVFNLVKKTTRSIVPGVEAQECVDIGAFDGTCTFDGSVIINVADGKARKIPPVRGEVLGLKDGVAYSETFSMDTRELVATPLDQSKPSRVLHRIACKEIVNISSTFIMLSDGTFRAWDGRTWTKVSVENN